MQPNSAVEVFNNWMWLLSGKVLGMSRIWVRVVENFGIKRDLLLPDGGIAVRSTEGVLYESHPRVLLSAVYFGRRVIPQCGTTVPAGVPVPELDACVRNVSRLVRGTPIVLDFVRYEIRSNCDMVATEVGLNYAGEPVDVSLTSMRHIYSVLRYGTDHPC